MFGYTLIRTKKLEAIYSKIAIFALKEIKRQKLSLNGDTRKNNSGSTCRERNE